MKDGNIYVFIFKYTKNFFSQMRLSLGYSINNYYFTMCIKNSSEVTMTEFHFL